MVSSWELPFTVRSYEIDGQGRAQLATITNYLQEAAVRHAIELKVARGQMEPHLTWMLARLRVEMRRWPHLGDDVAVRTWPAGLQRLYALRDFELGDGWGVATSSWLVVDVHARRPVRVPDSVRSIRLSNPERVLDGFRKIPELESGRRVAEYPVRWSECDSNGHANLSAYVAWAVDVLPVEFLHAHVPQSLEMEFRAEARPGDTVRSEETDGIHALRRTSDGAVLARARIRWREA